MIKQEKAGSFFQEYQKKNIMTMLQNTVHKIINEWLSDDEDHLKLQSLQQLAGMSVGSSKLPDHPLPDFVTHLWLDPHKTLDTLDKSILKREVRNLIKDTAKEIELVSTHKKIPQYDYGIM